jgi:hypothetical protein
MKTYYHYPGIPVFSTNKTNRHDMAAILLKVTLNTIYSPNPNPCDYEQNLNSDDQQNEQSPLTSITEHKKNHDI